MMKSKRSLVALGLAVFMAFFVGFSSTAEAFHAPNHGYFKGQSESGTWDNVWPASGGRSGCRGNGNALPTWVNTAQEFIDFTFCKLGGNTQERIGAAFIISTMTGQQSQNPGSAQRADFAARVHYAADRGWINWTASISCNPSSPPRNTFYQTTRQDVAWYWGCPVGASGQIVTSAITFYNGSSTYIIMRYCANPIGAMPPLAPAPQFSMSGSTEVNGGTSAEVLPGDQVDFRHRLTNNGPNSTSPTTINWSTPTVGPVSGASGNAGTFSNGQSKRPSAARQTFTVPGDASPGTRYCSRVSFNPRTHNGGSGNSTQRCAEVQYDFELQPIIEARVEEGQGLSNEFTEPGLEVVFEYSVSNNGLTESRSTNCTYRQATHQGFNESDPTQTFTPTGANCPPNRAFPTGTTQIATETIPASEVNVNTTICRTLSVDPRAHDNNGTATVKSCVKVVAKPYPRAYGGDVSAGNGFAGDPNVCTNYPEASIVGWNRRSGGSFAGAGVQHAAFALDVINDFATRQGNSGAPSGLAFANRDVPINHGDGVFGGQLGDVPCIANHYGDRPDDGSPLGPNPNLSSLGASGEHSEYTRNGSLTLNGGQINPGEQVTIYVDGNVFISDNVNYPGSWQVDRVPVFRLIASGNIYIGNNVTQLDGLYVAQGDGTSNGVIYTCATGNDSPVSEQAGNFYDVCNTKLVVNGSFVASQIRFLRNNGTLSQSQAGDSPPGGGAAAEVFNYNPTMWLNQPALPPGERADYDAIISLPPVL